MKAWLKTITLGAIAAALAACGASPEFALQQTTNPATTQTSAEQALNGMRITFRYTDYYSLTAPLTGTNCAGDAMNYYDPLASNGGALVPYAASTFNATQTIHPAFINNISVDMTDANTNVPQNSAYTCSYGNGTGVPAPSNCATFDYGAIGGIPTNMGGTMVLIGGIQGPNYAGYNPSYAPMQGLAVSCGPVYSSSSISPPVGYGVCSPSVYALSIDSLPATAAASPPTALAPGLDGVPSGPISSWANLSSGANYSGPPGLAGAAAAYDPGTGQIVTFGGSEPFTPSNIYNAGVTVADSWVYNVGTQTWTELTGTYTVAAGLETQTDIDMSTGTARDLTLSKGPGGRALFGYVAAPGVALSGMSSNGVVSVAGTAPTAGVDTTDRIVIVGGLSATQSAVVADSHRFNPTYAPDYVDTLGRFSPVAGWPAIPTPYDGPTGPASFEKVQWLDNYHTQLMDNSYLNEGTTPANSFMTVNYRTDFAPFNTTPSTTWSPTPNLALSQGVTSLLNLSGGGIVGAGYILGGGGFDPSMAANTPSTAASPSAYCSTLDCGGSALIKAPFAENQGNLGAETVTSNFSGIANLMNGNENTPKVWYPLPETDYVPAQGNSMPWFGGGTMLPGFDLGTNDVVFFGGADCLSYLDDVSATCNFNNQGRYWSFGTSPMADSFQPIGSTPAPWAAASPVPVPTGLPNNKGFSGTLPPGNAGMASARGMDPSGNPVVIAWGGMTTTSPFTAPGTSVLDTSGYVYVMYNSGGTPAWASVATSGGPAPMANAAMVYSHVTGKFYLFGGYSPTSGITSGDTWSLSISSSSPNCGTTGVCTFVWTQLDVTNGLTSYPSACVGNTTCPPPRRSHRMVEVNYSRNSGNTNPLTAVSPLHPLEPNCTSNTAPCSFGIFMEGGTSNGSTYLTDRWMFDPTANGGRGNWQLMYEMPPRTLAAMTSVDYAVPSTGQTVHRAVLFGGETGLHSPEQGQTGDYFVPPTLGDTWMFDFDAQTWNRVQLLGEGFNGSPSSLAPGVVTESDILQGYNANSPTTIPFPRAGGPVTGPSLAILTPPPLSGAIMVTRTLNGPSIGNQADPLAIPEIYLIGGRTKDGLLNPLNGVYKFCAGTTGEKRGDIGVDNGTCDSYDPILNPNSTSPQAGYIGRWLYKTPNVTGLEVGTSYHLASFQGAGTYDPYDDKILVTGGQGYANATSSLSPIPSVLNVNDVNTDPSGNLLVLEYTPPAFNGDSGSWQAADACSGQSNLPQGRFGHSMGYDTVNHQIVVTGGYSMAAGEIGVPLTQSMTYYDGQTYEMPEVWTATRSVVSGVPCYNWTQVTIFGNSINIPTETPPFSGFGNAAAIYIPSSGFNTGYYTMNDDSCANEGPIELPNSAENKLLAGGVDIDLDRSQLGPNENLLLNITYLPMGPGNVNASSIPLTTTEAAQFNIHLVKTGLSIGALQAVLQPRYMTYADTSQYPEIAQDVAILAPPTGQVRQEQVLIPLGIDPTIDRIRIERYSGSGILIDATLYRMGYR